MNQVDRRFEEYGSQLDAWSCAMARGNVAEVLPDVCVAGRSQVQEFAKSLLAKRLTKLNKQFEFLQDVLPDLTELLEVYASTVPAAAHDHGVDDAQGFLHWLETNPLTPEQRDFMECQRARQAVEFAARRNRTSYLNYLNHQRGTDRLVHALTAESATAVVFNPASAWGTFHTGILLAADDPVPAQFLCFAAGHEIRAAVFDVDGRMLVDDLRDRSPCSAADWCGGAEAVAGQRDRLEFVGDLANLGIVALTRSAVTI
jgi:hypothetical protein